MQDDVFETTNAPNDRDYEKISYGKAAYKRIQRLRRKGERRGIDVPPLGYELNKPEKPRIAFWIVAIISAAIFVAVIVLIGFMYNELIKAFSDMSGLGDLIKVLFKPDVLAGSFGTSVLPGLLLAAVYILIGVLFILPIIAAIYFYRFVRDAFYMAKCSKEEFAKGSIISSRIFGIFAVIAVLIAVLIIFMINVSASSAKLYMGLIFGGLICVLGGLLVLMIIEKRKCGKWFESLDESQKQNYLAHEGAIRSIKRTLKFEKNLWNDFGR